MGLGEHLEELRRRVAWSLGALVPVFMVLFYYSKQLLELVLRPMRAALLAEGLPGQIQATGVVETFLAATIVAAIGTLVVCSPWIVWQAWRFVGPGLYGHERKFAYVLAPLSAILSACAVAFMYFVMLPVLLAFLVVFSAGVGSDAAATGAAPAGMVFPSVPVLANDPVDPKPGTLWFNSTLHELRLATAVGNTGAPGQTAPPDSGAESAPASAGETGPAPIAIWAAPMGRPTGVALQPRVSDFVSLFLTMALGFVGAFQVPVVVLLLGWIGVVDVAAMRRYRRYVVVVCAIAGAVLTPSPDPFSMMLMTVPMYGLYELGLLLLWLMPATKMTAPVEDADVPSTSSASTGPSMGAPGEPPGGPADGP